MTITKLIEAYRTAVLMLLPLMDKVGIGWREWERYDEWDRIKDALFASIVCDAMSHEYCPPPVIGHIYKPEEHSLLFELTLGEEFYFSHLSHGESPFDTAHFDPVGCTSKSENSGAQVERPISGCSFAVLRKPYRPGEPSGVTTTANIGAYGSPV